MGVLDHHCGSNEQLQFEDQSGCKSVKNGILPISEMGGHFLWSEGELHVSDQRKDVSALSIWFEGFRTLTVAIKRLLAKVNEHRCAEPLARKSVLPAAMASNIARIFLQQTEEFSGQPREPCGTRSSRHDSFSPVGIQMQCGVLSRVVSNTPEFWQGQQIRAVNTKATRNRGLFELP